MPGKKGTSRAPDGSYVPTEEAKRLWAEQAAPKKRKKAEVPPEVTEIVGSGEQRKLTKKGNTKKYPRVTITEYDDKGRRRSITYVCDPASLSISRNERIEYTATGKSKSALWLTIESDVLEIE